jgi:membrane-associated phospholipid phosphatase
VATPIAQRLLALDVGALRTLRTRGHTPKLEHLARDYSRAGEHGACWFVLGGLGLALTQDDAKEKAFMRGLYITAATYAANTAIKRAVGRPRPQLAGLPPLSGVVSKLSFPSAHSSTSFAAALAYSRVLPPAPLYAAAGLFALSRPYLGVHYPSDVLAGAALGTLLSAAWPG